MITFPFIAGRSFLNYPTHPITIRKACYPELQTEGLTSGDVVVATADGHIRGIIYSGNAGWGPYYQIRARGKNPGDPSFTFAIGQHILVEIQKSQTGILVTLNVAE